MDTFGEVACTERSRAGGSHCATPTEKKCTQEGFFASRKRSCGTRPRPPASKRPGASPRGVARPHPYSPRRTGHRPP
eukprot:scaffold120614_cov38-Phaeocystis_antarctica.AAC.1